jgi:hypothetical protein
MPGLLTVKYKAPRMGRSTKSRPKSVREIEMKSPEDVPGLINGKTAGSSYEWNVARALWTLGWEQFDYQKSLFGGRGVRGGVVLDFVVPTRPAETVISVIGEYWHRDTDADKIEELKILSYMGHGTRILRPGTPESATYELALQFCSQKLGRA